jgi:hypothetical protein
MLKVIERHLIFPKDHKKENTNRINSKNDVITTWPEE